MPRPIPGMALVALLALASSGAFAQDYPTRIVIVVFSSLHQWL